MNMDSKEFDGVTPDDTRKKQEKSDIKGFICFAISMWIIVIISITRGEDNRFIMIMLILAAMITITMLYLLIDLNRKNKTGDIIWNPLKLNLK